MSRTSVATSPARIERLQSGGGERWRSIRLSALSEAPYAFGTTYAEAARWPTARWEAQVVEFATFIAVVDGRDIGVARAAHHTQSDVRELISMWVAPAARGQGIGAQLIESVATWAKASGATTLVLDVVTANAAAIARYERSGFVRCAGDALGGCAPGELRFVRSLTTLPA